MEIKFKPEPEKKIEGTENIPEKEIEGTENIPEKEIDGAENVPVTEDTKEAQEIEENSAADVTVDETGGQKECGDELAGKDAPDMESVGETSVAEPTRRRRRRSRKGNVSLPAVDQEMIGEAVEKKPLRGWQKVLLTVGVIVLAGDSDLWFFHLAGVFPDGVRGRRAGGGDHCSGKQYETGGERIEGRRCDPL